MPIKKLFIFTAISFLIIGSAILAVKVVAQEITNTASIQYPVAELGNCQDKAACKLYCNNPENIEVCLGFAEKNNLMTKAEIDTAKKFTAINVKKPGGCTAKDSCEAYCDDISHIDECITFATENDLIPPKELEEAKKVQAAIKRGIKPPACGNKKACDTYCDSPDHMEECINFAMEAGFMSDREKADSQKMLAAVKRGIKPPPCKGKEACDEYCSQPNNMETCMTFAMEAGFMSDQEKADSQKMLAALKKGVVPPKCKGKEECDVYCQQEEHFEECLNFSEAAGFMSPEEATMARKTGGKGPGGCKGKNECEAFCNNPDNQETCFNFGKENGLIPEEDLKRMEQGKQQFKQSLSQAPQEILDCLNSQLGSEMMEKLKTGAVIPPKEIGESMRGCYEKIGPPSQGGPGSGGMRPPAGQTGPGGCATPEECQSYCATNPQECQNLKTPTPPTSGGAGQSGPNEGPGNGMGISNEQLEEIMKNQPACESPEQCQQIQQRIEQQIQQQVQNQIQNQMAAPQPTPYSGPTPQPAPYPNQPQPQQYQQPQQPSQYQQPPQQYQQYQQPPQQPTPGSTPNTPTPPPPSSFLAPENFLGSILAIFNLTFGITK